MSDSAVMGNEEAFEQLLSSIEQSTITERDKGTRFETLVLDWLQTEPAYRDLFVKVQRYKDWAAEHPDLASSRKDIGIDLVGTNVGNDKFTAIQCKFYAKDQRVSKAEVDSFIAASARACFSDRLLIATNERWSDNLEEELKHLDKPVTIITRSNMAGSMVQWDDYLKHNEVKLSAPKELRPYQKDAIKNVILGFKNADRGKLIMACGTGKTFTSLRLTEQFLNNTGMVLFLVPSLSLLSQTLTEWKRQSVKPVTAFAVCSDSSTGKADSEDIESLTKRDELAYPATTTAEDLARNIALFRPQAQGLTVVFSTYHSLQVISDAQHKYGLGEFDLIICDEAHRTAGGYFKDEEESIFTRIHDADFVKGKKRLYMTATPKVYVGDARKQADNDEIVLYSMEDEKTFGKTFYTLSFNEAVRLGCLVDYKVLVLTLDESIIGNRYTQDLKQIEEDGGLSVPHAVKVIGCWKAMSKTDIQNELSVKDDLQAMKRAVGFAQVIHPSKNYDRVSSMQFAEHFHDTVEQFKQDYVADSLKKDPSFDAKEFLEHNAYSCECKHIDGSMSAIEKDALISWLKEPTKEDQGKILFNVRCLSEGVDVPALDAVIFLSPRKSQVDVVQTVGRVMRMAQDKKRGYVIIPIVVPPKSDPASIINNNKDFQVVWQVLRALKSIDANFGSVVDGQLGKIDPDKIGIVCISRNAFAKKSKQPEDKKDVGSGKKPRKLRVSKKTGSQPHQTDLFGRDQVLEDAIKSTIVKKIGNRREWGEWAEDVGEICQEQIKQIQTVINNPDNKEPAEKFARFKEEFRAILNSNISDDDVIEMLAQHIVIKPVMDALFEDYHFTEQNPIARGMTAMVEALDREGMLHANMQLDGFYDAVKRRMQNIHSSADRQTVILELFERFFKYAFPKQQEKLGIVYTPVEIVDFINHSVNDLLQREFGMPLSEHGVHVLDPFTGTGTFMTRLMQSDDIIPADKLAYKYNHDLHAFEIVPLAYYIASMNVESVFHERVPGAEYHANAVTVLTDTFASHKSVLPFVTALEENNQKRMAVDALDIRVIVGNPPYSARQKSRNDDNQNEHYEDLERAISLTYAAKSKGNNLNALYDSYIKAFRWASDRIGTNGIVAFVTNAGWIDSASADGMRKCFAEEFNDIYVYHLKGNQRTLREQSHKEGGKIFGQGSRAPIAITILIKNSSNPVRGQIHFATVDDYLTREDKLKQVAEHRSVIAMKWQTIFPDKHGDWINQRRYEYENFISVDGKKGSDTSIFMNYSLGIATGRDPWSFNSSAKRISDSFHTCIAVYNEQVRLYKQSANFERINDPVKIKWSDQQIAGLPKGLLSPVFNQNKIVTTEYRPFFKQFLYNEKFWIQRTYQIPKIFPSTQSENLIIVCSGKGAKEFSCLMTDKIVSLDFMEKSQCFPRYLYSENNLLSNDDSEEYERYDAISSNALQHFRQAYPEHEVDITVDSLFYYIYGILHSQEYRTQYANNLSKELPRIPRVASFELFKAFETAGRKLADLHVNYEKQQPYTGCTIEAAENPRYQVLHMKYGTIPGKKGNADKNKDKSVVIFNPDITIRNIPLEAQEYVVNKKSALDWIVERCCDTTDQDTGIRNNFNDYAEALGQPHYIFDLVLRIITVSLETVRIVKSLPKLYIHPLDLKQKP